jgi:hypothetical protein
LDDALCRAVVPCRDDPVVSPPYIEDTTHSLQKVEHEEGELREFSEASEWQREYWQADHVDVSRTPEQLPVTVWKRLPIPSHVPLCNISSNKQKRHVNGSQTYADPDKYDDDTNGTNERCFGCYL